MRSIIGSQSTWNQLGAAGTLLLLSCLQFTAYMKEIKAQEQEAARLDAVFPCILEVSMLHQSHHHHSAATSSQRP